MENKECFSYELSNEDIVKARLIKAKRKVCGRCLRREHHTGNLEYKGDIIVGFVSVKNEKPAERREMVAYLFIFIYLLSPFLIGSILLEMAKLFNLLELIGGKAFLMTLVIFAIMGPFFISRIKKKILKDFGCPICGAFEELFIWEKKGRFIEILE